VASSVAALLIAVPSRLDNDAADRASLPAQPRGPSERASTSHPAILILGAAGRLGGVGGQVVDILRSKGLSVRAVVRTDDDRAEALGATGAEIVVGDLSRAEDVARALDGRPKWSVSPDYPSVPFVLSRSRPRPHPRRDLKQNPNACPAVNPRGEKD
jgi:hypothetical protein